MSIKSLKAIVAEVIECAPDSLTEQSGMNVTENWDSLKQFLIMSAIEQDLSATFAISDMERVGSLGEIRSLLAAQGIITID